MESTNDRASLFASRDGRLEVSERPVGIQVCVGRADDFRSCNLGPEEVAFLAHALNKWIGRFTSNA